MPNVHELFQKYNKQKDSGSFKMISTFRKTNLKSVP